MCGLTRQGLKVIPCYRDYTATTTSFRMKRVCSDRILTCRIKKHMLTCQVGLVVIDLITSPVVSWRGCETPPSTAAQLSFFAQPRS